jgi:DNA-binding NtrC family response regulator
MQGADASSDDDEHSEIHGSAIEQPLRFIEEAPLLKTDVPPEPSVSEKHGALPMLDSSGDLRPLADLEAEIIRFGIAHCRGRMSQVARRLGIGRSTLYRKLESMGLAGAGRATHDSVSDG